VTAAARRSPGVDLARIEEQGREWARRSLAARPLTEDQKRRIRTRTGLGTQLKTRLKTQHPPARRPRAA
jgi:hypothetical protein